LKGTLEVMSAPGRGTRIRARIPAVAVNSIGPQTLAGR
jgi:chemotaxis protein histidine kinase CheA